MSRRRLQALKYSPLSRLATLPLRLRVAFAPPLVQFGRALRWLPRSREWTSFSVDYEEEGLLSLVAAVACITGREPDAVQGFVDELRSDEVFAARFRQRVRDTRLRHVCDPELRYGRCLVNYLLVRASGARVVFEAGTANGLSSWAIVRALQRTGTAGSLLITADIGDDRGGFLEGDEGGLVRRLVGDSVAALAATPETIDGFIHDTLNEPAHTRAQFAALARRLAPRAWVATSWFNAEFVQFCRSHDLRCIEWVERVRDHWYGGRRCGFAMRCETR